LETNWHRMQMNLLIESVHYHWREREDYFTGGNMFIYFSVEQVRNRDYRGPDFFVVKGVDSSHDRAAWIVWEESRNRRTFLTLHDRCRRWHEERLV